MSVEHAPTHAFRPRFWRGVAILWVPFVAVVVWDYARRGIDRPAITAFAILGALTALVYAVGWRPVVVGEPNRIVVKNPFRTAVVPWNAVTDIDVKDALRVHTKIAVIRTWAVDRGGAASNTFRGWNSQRLKAPGVERQALAELARQGPADVALMTLTELWRQRRGQTRGTPEISWDWPTIGAIVVLTAVSVALLATG